MRRTLGLEGLSANCTHTIYLASKLDSININSISSSSDAIQHIFFEQLLNLDKMIIVKPKQAGTCGRSIRNEYTSKSLICTNIKYNRTYYFSLSRLNAILVSITKKTARKWKFGNVEIWQRGNLARGTCVLRPQVPACFGFTIAMYDNYWIDRPLAYCNIVSFMQ